MADPLDLQYRIDNNVPVIIDASTFSNFSWEILGTWVGTIIVSASVSGEAYDQITFMVPSNGARVQNITGNGQWTFPTKGYRFFKFSFSAFTSGTAILRVYEGDFGFLFLENYQVRDISSNVITITTTKDITLRNAVTCGVLVQVLVTAVTGTVNWPAMSLYQSIDSQTYTIAGPHTKAGTISANQFVSWLLYPAASGGAFDFVDPCPIPRQPVLRLVWTLPGGASITYTELTEYLVG